MKLLLNDKNYIQPVLQSAVLMDICEFRFTDKLVLRVRRPLKPRA